MSFNSLGLSEALLKAINKKGYTEPSTIQGKVIPIILEGKDILASAQTGTGKTAGFTLPLLEILSKGPILRNRPIRALVLTPTRELAAQVYDSVRAYSQFLDFKSTVVFGGVNTFTQKSRLRNGVDLLVATPGRLLDLYGQRALSLNKVEILVLDEADRMLDMGFTKDINRILELLPPKRQNLLFSATLSKEIKQLAKVTLQDPVLVEIPADKINSEKIIQKVYHVDKDNKQDLLIKLVSEGEWQQVLVFTRTKHGADKLCDKLNKNKIRATAIHGNKSQGARTKALDSFKKNFVRVLVATDVASRGLDIPKLPHVINYELPEVAEDYVHRIGRTGRAGATGEAISLVSNEELFYIRGIEKLQSIKIPIETIEGFEPKEKASYSQLQGAPRKSNQFRRSSSSQRSGGGSRNSHGGGNSNWKNKRRSHSQSFSSKPR